METAGVFASSKTRGLFINRAKNIPIMVAEITKTNLKCKNS